jgi:hypothetical protein
LCWNRRVLLARRLSLLRRLLKRLDWEATDSGIVCWVVACRLWLGGSLLRVLIAACRRCGASLAGLLLLLLLLLLLVVGGRAVVGRNSLFCR